MYLYSSGSKERCKSVIGIVLIYIKLQAQEIGKLNEILHMTFSAQNLDNKVSSTYV